MSAPPWDLRAAVGGAARAWQGFFFAPVDARLCGLLRIGFALLLLVNLAVLYPDLERWFTGSGVLPAADVALLQAGERWSLLNWLPDNLASVQVAFALFALQSVLLLLGVASRFQAACVLVWLISFQHRNPLILDSEDGLLRLMGCYLLLVPLGAAWSVDRWRQRQRDGIAQPVAAPGVRLLQLQMAVIFLSAAWCKLNGDPWRAGTALFYVAQLDDSFGRLAVPAWIVETPWLVRTLTWFVIGVEIAIPLGVWFRQTRRPALALALVFHLANELTMHLFLFHWIMLLGWCAFLLPGDFSSHKAATTGRGVPSLRAAPRASKPRRPDAV